MTASHRITISLTEDQNNEVTRISRVHGLSKSEVVRAVLEQFLNNDEVSHNFNPNTSLKGKRHARNHPGDVMGNPRSDELIAAYKDTEDGDP